MRLLSFDFLDLLSAPPHLDSGFRAIISQTDLGSTDQHTKAMSNREVFENSVASVVDVASIMVAYRIGIAQSSIYLGVAYAIFDAILVIWLRRPLSHVIHKVFTFRSGRQIPNDWYEADLA